MTQIDLGSNFEIEDRITLDLTGHLMSYDPRELEIVQGANSYRGSCSETFHGDGYKLKVIGKRSRGIVKDFPRGLLEVSDKVATAIRSEEKIDENLGKILMKNHGHFGFFPRGFPDYVVALRVYTKDAPKRMG